MSYIRDLNLITENPARKAFEEGQRTARERETHDLNIDSRKFDLDNRKLEQPFRLRQLELGNKSSEMNITSQDMRNWKELVNAMESGNTALIQTITERHWPDMWPQVQEIFSNERMRNTIIAGTTQIEAKYGHNAQGAATALEFFFKGVADAYGENGAAGAAAPTVPTERLVQEAVTNPDAQPLPTQRQTGTGSSAFMQRYNSWLVDYPGDTKGARNFAANTNPPRESTDVQLRTRALQEAKYLLPPPQFGDTPAKQQERADLVEEIFQQLKTERDAGNVAPAPRTDPDRADARVPTGAPGGYTRDGLPNAHGSTNQGIGRIDTGPGGVGQGFLPSGMPTGLGSGMQQEKQRALERLATPPATQPAVPASANIPPGDNLPVHTMETAASMPKGTVFRLAPRGQMAVMADDEQEAASAPSGTLIITSDGRMLRKP